MHQTGFLPEEKQEGYPALRGFHEADAVIVGGGLTGITTALWLCRAGLRVRLLEAETLGCGATARCAGMLSLTDRVLLAALERERGTEVAGAYVRSRMAAFGAIRAIAAEAPGRLDWLEANAHILAWGRKQDLPGEAEALRRMGVHAQAHASGSAPLPAESILTLRDMACLDAAAYFFRLTELAVSQGLVIHEHSRVTALETNMAQTDHGAVRAPYVVIATGYPLVNVPGWYFLRLRQRRRGLFITESSAAADGMFYDAQGRYALRRWQEGLLLQLDLGGVGQRREETPEQRYRRTLGTCLGDALSLCEGVETFSADGLPYIGVYSRKTPNLFVAAGYGGNGLLGSMTAAQLISARVLGLSADSAFVFSGQRSGNSVVRRELGSALAMAGRYAGGMLRLGAPRCPHMGCRLVYSRSRRIWECPCHGSRFDDIGHLLNAPASEDAIIHHKR